MEMPFHKRRALKKRRRLIEGGPQVVRLGYPRGMKQNSIPAILKRIEAQGARRD